MRFALALVANPDLLVLDEPTVAMDVEARRAFWATMRRFTARGTTVVFATHYLEEADEYADRVVLMAHGRVVADGPSTEIKARVGMRTIRATLPDVDRRARGAARRRARPTAAARPSVLTLRRLGPALRALLGPTPSARHRDPGAGLEEAFLEITGEDDPEDEEAVAAMSTATYVRYEVLRTFRNRRFFIFSLIFPVTMYLLIAGPNKDSDLGRASRRRSTTWSAWSASGHDGRRHRRVAPASPRSAPWAGTASCG